MIDNYKFGEIVIDGEKYTDDVEIRWTGQVLEWWREEGHEFRTSDLKRVFTQQPDLVVLGTGYYGKADVQKGLLDKLDREGVEYTEALTESAVEVFNEVMKDNEGLEKEEKTRVIGLFHITC